MSKKLKGMNYGKKNTIKSDLDIKKSKIRITTMIDFPIYESLKEEAEQRGMGYQTLLNEILKARFMPDSAMPGIDLNETARLIEEYLRKKYDLKKIEKKRPA